LFKERKRWEEMILAPAAAGRNLKNAAENTNLLPKTLF